MLCENDFTTNAFIAAFTTANARLRLYEMLDILGESVVYYDTDIIVFIDYGKMMYGLLAKHQQIYRVIVIKQIQVKDLH